MHKSLCKSKGFHNFYESEAIGNPKGLLGQQVDVEQLGNESFRSRPEWVAWDFGCDPVDFMSIGVVRAWHGTFHAILFPKNLDRTGMVQTNLCRELFYQG